MHRDAKAQRDVLYYTCLATCCYLLSSSALTMVYKFAAVVL